MYVLDHNRQISLIGEMTQLRKNAQTWEVYYHDPATNVMWKSYFPKATSKARGPKILRTEPVSDILEQRLANCLVEPVSENAIGLGIELSTVPANWVRIMDVIEQHYRLYHRRQLPLFLHHLQVEDYESLFDEINYDPENTEDKFDELAGRSRTIRFKRFFFP